MTEDITQTEVVTQDSDNPAVTGEAAEANPKQIVISVQNPTEDEMKELMVRIQENHDFNVDVKPVNFNFKKSKDKDTGIETIRDTVQLGMAYPSIQGLVDILGNEDKKGLELLMEAVETVINAAARDLLYEDTSLTAATFPMNKVSWEYIANLPKAQRRGGGIAKEIWEAFGNDYVEVMPKATGKSPEQVANAAKMLVGKLTSVRTAEPVLQLLVEQLAIYMDNSPNVEDFKDCVAFLLNKADAYLNVSDEDLIANL